MFQFVQGVSMQLVDRMRRFSDRCKQKYILIEEDAVYLTSSHTLSKMEKKKGFHTNTMKPMSAHDERTLDTAVAMANEITTKSMNDLDGDIRQPNSPKERSKFLSKFTQLHLHHQSHELDRDPLAGKHAERRNFSEEANSVPDIQSSITEESKQAYTSLIENPTPSLITHMVETKGVLKPATIPKPAPRDGFPRSQFHSLQKPAGTWSSNEEIETNIKNELPLPPRSTKPKLVDKPRHIRKHPLKLPSLPPPQLNQPIIYQNALSPIALANPMKIGVDVCDGFEKVQVQDTNPFTSSANPFNSYLDDELRCTLDYNDGSDGRSDENDKSGLLKDCLDHVSVEDLLEFADQKPCGRQRGVESDEVRIMSKVLKEQTSPEQCLEALEVCDWNVHLAIKVVRVSEAGSGASLAQCAASLGEANGDVDNATAQLNKQLN